jgi:protoporphyrinogen oxidase
MEKVDVLVIGAGPSGLTAAWMLRERATDILVCEREERIGGLMKSYYWQDFIYDVGRKEMYSRIPEVDAMWTELLGDAYRPYPHRVGSLFGGHILELSGKHRGLLRGIPLHWLVKGGFSLLWSWLRATVRSPKTYEDFWHNRVGGTFAGFLAQGYWEKFRGQRWADMPIPAPEASKAQKSSYSFGVIGQAFKLASQGGMQSQKIWRHPAKGSGQIGDALMQKVADAGIPVALETEVKALNEKPGEGYEVTLEHGGKTRTVLAGNVISSLPIERLCPMIVSDGKSVTPPNQPLGADAERSVILTYLFLDEPPRFPHAWLEVNDRSLACGRITNFAAFGGDMVPDGKTCLCVECFCDGDDPLLTKTDDEMVTLATEETAKNGLIDPAKIIHGLVFKMKRTNAAASWREWQSAWRNELLGRLESHARLFHTNRPGADWATYAGMLAAEAILDGDRRVFDERADPRKRYDETAAAARKRATETAAPPAGVPAPSQT